MKLDPAYLHFISKEELRILQAIEIGMRNHEYVSRELITRIGNLRGGETFKTIQRLLKNKFIVHIGNKCDGYKLTYMGYDYLALNTFIKRGLIKEVLSKIGVGKESDIYKCKTPDGEFVVLKLTRLGRNSFRSIKKNREYIQNRTSYNWLYLSRLSSVREFLFMQLLHKYGFSVPKPIDTNRHGTLMSLVDGDAFCRVQRISTQKQIRSLFETCLDIAVKFAKHGLIHCDYNEFNIMVNDTGSKVTVIDFPQCISAKHPNAATYFNRDVECIYTYFDKLAEKSYGQNVKNRQEGDLGETKLNVEDYPMPQLQDIQIQHRLDHEIKNVGHITLEEYNMLEKYRTEEERMRLEMEQGEEGEEEGEFSSEEFQQEDLEREEKEMEELEKANILEGNQELNAIEQIIEKKEGAQYDEELNKLINDFEGKIQQKEEEGEEDEQESSEEEERFKGMTPFEIRIKLKEEKRLEREKKKAELTTNELIKKSLKNNRSKKPMTGKGNHGNKDKIKQRNLQIKNDFF